MLNPHSFLIHKIYIAARHKSYLKISFSEKISGNGNAITQAIYTIIVYFFSITWYLFFVMYVLFISWFQRYSLRITWYIKCIVIIITMLTTFWKSLPCFKGKYDVSHDIFLHSCQEFMKSMEDNQADIGSCEANCSFSDLNWHKERLTT